MASLLPVSMLHLTHRKMVPRPAMAKATPLQTLDPRLAATQAQPPATQALNRLILPLSLPLLPLLLRLPLIQEPLLPIAHKIYQLLTQTHRKMGHRLAMAKATPLQTLDPRLVAHQAQPRATQALAAVLFRHS